MIAVGGGKTEGVTGREGGGVGRGRAGEGERGLGAVFSVDCN